MSLFVIKPGNHVRVKDADIDAVVSQVLIGSERYIQYVLVWWIGHTRQVGTFDEWELNIGASNLPDDSIERIGFK